MNQSCSNQFPMFDEAAIDAVAQWEYTPTLMNGNDRRTISGPLWICGAGAHLNIPEGFDRRRYVGIADPFGIIGPEQKGMRLNPFAMPTLVQSAEGPVVTYGINRAVVRKK